MRVRERGLRRGRTLLDAAVWAPHLGVRWGRAEIFTAGAQGEPLSLDQRQSLSSGMQGPLQASPSGTLTQPFPSHTVTPPFPPPVLLSYL